MSAAAAPVPPSPRSRSRAPRILLAGGALIVLLLVLAQLVLPGIAAHRIRDRVARYGTVLSTSVSAFPAVELLWGHAESASVKATRLHTTPKQTVKLLSDARNINKLNLAVDAVKQGPLALHNVSVAKHGDAVLASASLSQAVIHTTLAGGIDLQPTVSNGQLLMRASGGLFGQSASITALVSAQNGDLIVAPQGGFLASLARITLFTDPRLEIDNLAARVDPTNASDYRVSLSARLR